MKGAKSGAVGGMTGSGCPSTFLSQFGADARPRMSYAGHERRSSLDVQLSLRCYSEFCAQVSA